MFHILYQIFMENNAIKIHSHRRRHRNKDKPPRCLRCRVIPGKPNRNTHRTCGISSGLGRGVVVQILRFFIPSGDLHLSERRATKTATTTLWLRSSVTLNRSECECSFFFLFCGPVGWIIQRQSAEPLAAPPLATCHLPHHGCDLNWNLKQQPAHVKMFCKMPKRCT